ncbi:ArpU family phage packaging/lysis transcriptional regulator [Vagococcus fluvialis]|uniref:ArpU family phage packaging/lysis transcriptional regulator n=1 Tax=Vagococcus fluvialis TaxID=2738 RepID=UPI00378948B6
MNVVMTKKVNIKEVFRECRGLLIRHSNVSELIINSKLKLEENISSKSSYLKKIVEILNELEETEKMLILEKYVKSSTKKNVYIYMKLNLSERTFYRLKKKAVDNFESLYNQVFI